VGKGAKRRAHVFAARYDVPMPHYRRLKIEGGTFFFTVTLADRSGDLLVRHIDRLRSIYQSVQTERHFESVAVCVLPDHLHAI
jgi:putative transposase